MSFTRFISATATAAMLASSATALTISLPCDYDASGMAGLDGKSWKNGLVISAYFPETAEAKAWLPDAKMRMMDCNTGKFSVLMSKGQFMDDALADAMYVLYENEQMSIRKFERTAKANGAKIKRFSDTEETCHCNDFFPELRGNKTPYQGTN